MKKVYASWEKRNLGVETWELEIEPQDSVDEYGKECLAVDAQYLVIKVPAGCADWGFFLQENGFKYVETLISFSRSTEIPELSKLQGRFLPLLSYSVMNNEDVEMLYREINTNMFATDRISLDPFFTKELSNRRYVGLLKDEFERGAIPYNIEYKGERVGFFVLRERENKVIYGSLGGMYPDVTSIGIGFSLGYLEIVAANSLGGKKILAAVSTNNKGSMAVTTQFGYSVDKMSAIYVKHL